MDYPADIAAIASEIVKTPHTGNKPEYTLLEAICAALVEERKRCAKIARLYLELLQGCDLSEDEPEQMSKAIITGNLPPEPLWPETKQG